MTLLERHPRGVSPTAAGQTLVGHAEGILARLDAAEAASAGDRRAARRAAAHGLVPDRRRDADAAGDRQLPRAPTPTSSSRSPRASPRRSCRACAPASSTSRCCSSSPTRARCSPATDARAELLEDPMYLALPARAPRSRTSGRLRLEDLAGEAWVQTSTSSPCARHVVRCCHARGLRAERLLRERRLPDRPGAGRRRRRRRPDPASSRSRSCARTSSSARSPRGARRGSLAATPGADRRSRRRRRCSRCSSTPPAPTGRATSPRSRSYLPRK